MPFALPENFGDATNAGAGGSYTEIRGIFPAAIYKIEPLTHQRKGVEVHAYSIDFRINGGQFDGEDVQTYVALYSDAIFTLQSILSAIGELDTYYKKGENGEKGKWVALPEASDLQGKQLYIQVDNAPWQSTDRQTKVGLVNPDGSPVLRDGNGISVFYAADKPAPEYRARTIKPQMAKIQPSNAGGQVPSVPGGFPGQVGAGSAAQDVWGGGATSQPGTAGW